MDDSFLSPKNRCQDKADSCFRLKLSKTNNYFMGIYHNFLLVIEIENPKVIDHLMAVRVVHKRRIIDHQCRDVKFPIASMV